MIGKKLYLIVVYGEPEGYTEKYLTESEAKLIKEIFEDTLSNEIDYTIEEIPSKEEFEDDFLSTISSGTLSDYQLFEEIKQKYGITGFAADYIYTRYN